MSNGPKINVSDRKKGETLHDYLTRKNIPCQCRVCRDKRKLEAIENNEKLDLNKEAG